MRVEKGEKIGPKVTKTALHTTNKLMIPLLAVYLVFKDRKSEM